VAIPSARPLLMVLPGILAVKAIKNYPNLLGEAKVREIDIWKNLWTEFLC
jgi:hypothetical protein